MLLHQLGDHLPQRIMKGHAYASQTHSVACFSTDASHLLLAVPASQHNVYCPRVHACMSVCNTVHGSQEAVRGSLVVSVAADHSTN